MGARSSIGSTAPAHLRGTLAVAHHTVVHAQLVFHQPAHGLRVDDMFVRQHTG